MRVGLGECSADSMIGDSGQKCMNSEDVFKLLSYLAEESELELNLLSGAVIDALYILYNAS